uniref:Uncharacterized protein n=1 Tax=Arundo donax TaxID=35708 RepID=A0A0A8Y692_ARUDO
MVTLLFFSATFISWS